MISIITLLVTKVYFFFFTVRLHFYNGIMFSNLLIFSSIRPFWLKSNSILDLTHILWLISLRPFYRGYYYPDYRGVSSNAAKKLTLWDGLHCKTRWNMKLFIVHCKNQLYFKSTDITAIPKHSFLRLLQWMYQDQ